MKATTPMTPSTPFKTVKYDDGSILSNVFLTEHQLAARHQRSVKTVRNLRVNGGYVPFLKIGRHVRYRLSDVLAFEEKSLKSSTSDQGGDNA